MARTGLDLRACGTTGFTGSAGSLTGGDGSETVGGAGGVGGGRRDIDDFRLRGGLARRSRRRHVIGDRTNRIARHAAVRLARLDQELGIALRLEHRVHDRRTNLDDQPTVSRLAMSKAQPLLFTAPRPLGIQVCRRGISPDAQLDFDRVAVPPFDLEFRVTRAPARQRIQ